MVKSKPKRVTKANLQEIIVEGMKKAQNFYIDLSEGYSISYGPEYVLTTFVGQELFKHGIYFDLECNTKFSLEDSGLKPRACPKNMRPTGRNDILIYNKQGANTAAVEIKNGVNNYKRIENDVKRIRGFIRKQVVEYGYIAFIMDIDHLKKEGDNCRKQINENIERLRNAILKSCSQSKKEEYNLSVSKKEYLSEPVVYKVDGKERIWIWASVCFCISH
jgi:predicted DNA-binding transcriptional regulator